MDQIAGPYSRGAKTSSDRNNNLRAMNIAAYDVFRRGHVPIIGVNMALPMIDAVGDTAFDEIMTPISLALAERCDAILRLPGASKGADEEVQRIQARGGKVYGSVNDVPDESAARNCRP